MFKNGRLRGEKVKYPDGIGCCVWYPFPNEDGEDDEDAGLCFDFGYDDIDDLIALLQEMKVTEPEIYQGD
jgi:hypothetical protein